MLKYLKTVLLTSQVMHGEVKCSLAGETPALQQQVGAPLLPPPPADPYCHSAEENQINIILNLVKTWHTPLSLEGLKNTNNSSDPLLNSVGCARF